MSTEFLLSLDIVILAVATTLDEVTRVATVQVDIRFKGDSVTGTVMVAPRLADGVFVANGDSPDQWVDHSLLDWIDELVFESIEGRPAQRREVAAFLSRLEAEAAAAASSVA